MSCLWHKQQSYVENNFQAADGGSIPPIFFPAGSSKIGNRGSSCLGRSDNNSNQKSVLVQVQSGRFVTLTAKTCKTKKLQISSHFNASCYETENKVESDPHSNHKGKTIVLKTKVKWFDSTKMGHGKRGKV